MRIGLILERFEPSRGGLEQWSFQFARKLLLAGHEVHAITFSAAPEVRELGVHLHITDNPQSRLEAGTVLQEKAKELALDIRHDMGVGWDAEVIHPHGGCLAAHFEHNLLRIPKWRRITFWREKRYRDAEEAERRQHADPNATIVCVSEMVKRHFLQHSEISPERLRVIFNGVDTDRFSPVHAHAYREQIRNARNAGNDVVFLLVAHNLQLKNAAACIRAISGLRGARLWIVGSRRAQRAERLTRKLRAPVDFIGPVPDSLPYYGAADVLVHPTWYDPCSLVTLEAAACGLPVITSDFNGMSDLMHSGRDGFLVEAGDITSLKQVMRELLDPLLRKSMGAAARDMALQHTFDRQVERFETLYRERVRQ